VFHGFNITVISKPISPHESRKNQPGNHYYCFVDLATVEECEAAIRQLDGLDKWNGRIKVHHTNGTSNKLHERQRLYIAGLPEFPSQETTESSVRELFEGYEITTISKLFFPKEKVEKRTGNHCFCFVEMNSGQEADRARLELDWKQMWGGEVRVKIATPNGRKADERTSRG
jgi:RNA recognition motif-containing protein